MRYIPLIITKGTQLLIQMTDTFQQRSHHSNMKFNGKANGPKGCTIRKKKRRGSHTNTKTEKEINIEKEIKRKRAECHKMSKLWKKQHSGENGEVPRLRGTITCHLVCTIFSILIIL
eukprot:123305_1